MLSSFDKNKAPEYPNQGQWKQARGRAVELQGDPGACFPRKFWQTMPSEIQILQILRVILKNI